MWQRFKTIHNKHIRPQLTKVEGALPAVNKANASPDELLGELFQDVQLQRVLPDGKTFVDLVPAGRLSNIVKAYERERSQPNFNLHEFVSRYFHEYLDESHAVYHSDPNHTPSEHIEELWSVLSRVSFRKSGSLTALPYPYITPGGRFSEQYYWDSYFIMLGLAAGGHYGQIEGMIKNYAYMIRRYGFIPTANRTYFLSRSQPPFFALMLKLLAKKRGKLLLAKYLPYLLSEYRFWMKDSKKCNEKTPAQLRCVRMPDGSLLNRYYDNKQTARSEMYRDDVEAAHEAADREPSRFYLDIRAAAESGWDFSSRWLRDGKNLHTIHTTDIVPIDLNCLLVTLEQTIADTYAYLKQPIAAKRFQKHADDRKAAIHTYLWSDVEQWYMDYNFRLQAFTPRVTAAGLFALYTGVADQAQANAVAKRTEKDFLRVGGIVTTLVQTGQQWDAPNGWAPLQWVAIQGLRNYGHDGLAGLVKRRWITTNLAVFKLERKMVEKYNVEDLSALASGGEYALQDGFGWTNGVLQALLAEEDS